MYNLRVCDIYNKGEFYNNVKNIIRVAITFDDTDLTPLLYDVPLSSVGIFKNPDPRFHKAMVFLPDSMIKKVAIDNPDDVKVGESK